MQFDLREVPFSTRGSYMAVSRHEAGFRGRNNIPENRTRERTKSHGSQDTAAAAWKGM